MTSIATSTTTRAITATSTRAITVKRRPSAGAWTIGLAVAWVTLALAGVYTSTLIPAALACIVVAFFHPPRLAAEPFTRLVDVCALAIAAVGLIQLAPLPASVTEAVSPASARVDAALALAPTGGARPLSIDPPSTMEAVGIFAGLVLLYLTARRILEKGGVRSVVSIVAVAGLVLSALALAQDATGRGRLYWGVVPIGEGPAPFGPFINRNHFATWSIMAVSLCLGYLRARAFAHGPASAVAPRRSRIAAAADGRALLLGAAAIAMIVATVRSLSRSGLVGLAVALLATWSLEPSSTGAWHLSRKSARHLWPLLVLLAAGIGIVLYVDPQALAARFGAAAPAAVDRLTIWRETIPILRDSWLTGTGLGTYLTAMLVYQQSHPGVIFNQAHNHFLQLAAEGGLLAAIPATIGLGALVRAGSGALRRDRSGMYAIRAGAAAGLAGVAAQSIWETGLTIPANGALAAVLLAILLHSPRGVSGTTETEQDERSPAPGRGRAWR